MIPGAKIKASKRGGTWRAVLAVELPDEYLQAEGEGTTKAEAIRAATEAYQDQTAPRKTCRGPNHEGPRELPKTLRHFRQEGKRTLRDGSPLLRHVCRACERAWQATYYETTARERRKSKTST